MFFSEVLKFPNPMSSTISPRRLQTSLMAAEQHESSP